ncbi:MAG: hypothetical protein JWQ07_5666, partial [Ramlibacter sp.]|nr:hypothetical protein [Ramlibacter sp.]
MARPAFADRSADAVPVPRLPRHRAPSLRVETENANRVFILAFQKILNDSLV